MGQRRTVLRHASGRRRAVAVLAGAALAVGVTTAVVATTSGGSEATGPVASGPALDVDPGPMRGSTLSPVVSARIAEILGRDTPAASVSLASGPSAPVRVEIPAIGVDAGVVPVSAPDRALLPPSDPDLLGWWSDGAEPGARRGSALITGHSVHTGGGALQDLARVGRGDEVVVETEAGRMEYAVTSTQVLDKPALAQQAPDLFSQEARGRVVLITCADWNGAEWLSNTVVTADPV